MNKVLIEVLLPATNRNFEIFIPLDLKFYEITLMISRVISELSNGLFISDNDSILCEWSTGELLNIYMSPRDLGLKNGAKLMLL